jgi:hypothetical protein
MSEDEVVPRHKIQWQPGQHYVPQIDAHYDRLYEAYAVLKGVQAAPDPSIRPAFELTLLEAHAAYDAYQLDSCLPGAEGWKKCIDAVLAKRPKPEGGARG